MWGRTMRLRLKHLLIATFVLGTVGAGTSVACSCTTPPGPATCSALKAIGPTGPSFVGTVIAIENPSAEDGDATGVSRYRFRVDENISGFTEREVDIYSERGSSDCSYHFRAGESYFVAPQRESGWSALDGSEGSPGKLFASICGETRPLATAGPLLNELRARKPTGAAVVGVLRTQPGPNDGDHRIPNALVELHGKSAILSTRTDEFGVYQFSGVPPGKYRLGVKVPPQWQSARDEIAALPSITIARKPCYEKDIVTSRAPGHAKP